MLKERLPKEVRLNGTCSSGADDDRNDRVLLRVVMCRLRYSGTNVCRCRPQHLQILKYIAQHWLKLLTRSAPFCARWPFAECTCMCVAGAARCTIAVC